MFCKRMAAIHGRAGTGWRSCASHTGPSPSGCWASSGTCSPAVREARDRRRRGRCGDELALMRPRWDGSDRAVATPGRMVLKTLSRRRRRGAAVRRARGRVGVPRQQLPAAAGAVLPVAPRGAVHAGGRHRAGGDQRGPRGPGCGGVHAGVRTPRPATWIEESIVRAAERRLSRSRSTSTTFATDAVAQDAAGQAPSRAAGPPAPRGVRVRPPGRRAAQRRHRGGRVGLLRQPAHPADDLGGVPSRRSRAYCAQAGIPANAKPRWSRLQDASSHEAAPRWTPGTRRTPIWSSRAVVRC